MTKSGANDPSSPPSGSTHSPPPLIDIESGPPIDVDEDDFDDPFAITTTKNASTETLRRWRQAALVLNASRRFRYTLDLRKNEDQEKRKRMIRSHSQVIRAALLFKLAGQREIVLDTVSPPRPTGGYGIALDQLVSMTRDHSISALHQYGGVTALSEMLKTDPDKGVPGDDIDLSNRMDVFGSNTYPVKEGRSYFTFVWEALQDLTLIILIIAAVVSLVLGIKTEVHNRLWLDYWTHLSKFSTTFSAIYSPKLPCILHILPLVNP